MWTTYTYLTGFLIDSLPITKIDVTRNVRLSSMQEFVVLIKNVGVQL